MVSADSECVAAQVFSSFIQCLASCSSSRYVRSMLLEGATSSEKCAMLPTPSAVLIAHEDALINSSDTQNHLCIALALSGLEERKAATSDVPARNRTAGGRACLESRKIARLRTLTPSGPDPNTNKQSIGREIQSLIENQVLD